MDTSGVPLGALFTREFCHTLLRVLVEAAKELDQDFYVKGGYACILRLAHQPFEAYQFRGLEDIGVFDVADVDCSWVPPVGQDEKQVLESLKAFGLKIQAGMVRPLRQAKAFEDHLLSQGIIYSKYEAEQLQVVRPHGYGPGWRGWLRMLRNLPRRVLAQVWRALLRRRLFRQLLRVFWRRQKILLRHRPAQVLATVNPCVPSRTDPSETFSLLRLKTPVWHSAKEKAGRIPFLDVSAVLTGSSPDPECTVMMVDGVIAVPVPTRRTLVADITRMMFLDSEHHPWVHFDEGKTKRRFFRLVLLSVDQLDLVALDWCWFLHSDLLRLCERLWTDDVASTATAASEVMAAVSKPDNLETVARHIRVCMQLAVRRLPSMRLAEVRDLQEWCSVLSECCLAIVQQCRPR